jgi:DNA invertase Pin-like site-specific DNA recombinase
MSTDKQEMSIADQEAKVNPWAKGRYRIVEAYRDEGKSASKDTKRRTAFLRMVKDVTEGKYKGKVRYILAVDKSRFDRLDTLDGAQFKKALRDAGAKFDSPLSGLIDWATPIGRLMDTVLSEANHQTPLLIAEKGLQGRIRVTKEGRPNQTTPYGMAKLVTSPTGDDIKVARKDRWATPKTWGSKFCPGEPAEAEGMRFAYTTFDGEDLSYNELAQRMYRKGYPPPGPAGEWHGDTLCWMLQNPVYAGGLRIGVQPKGKFFRTSGGRETAVSAAGPAEAIITWGCHEGIIDRRLWDRVQAKIQRNFKKRRPPRKSGPYALTGIMHCGNCGRPMYASRMPDGRVIYRCRRGELGNKARCGYWIAYERDFLPFLLGEFLKRIEREITQQAVETFSPKDNSLDGELAKLDRKLVQARERFLEAPPEVAKGLLATLQKWEREREELTERIKARQGQDQTTCLLDWWAAYSREFNDSNPVEIPGATEILAGGLVYRTKVRVPAAVLRERLKRIDTRVSVWFRKKTKGKGWDVDKVRAQAEINGELCYGGTSNAAS